MVENKENLESKDSKGVALCYARVSTNRQAQTGHSLGSQPQALAEAAIAAGYSPQIILEQGSGRNTARPALRGALERLRLGEAVALYALDIDRLARSTRHLLEIAEKSAREKWRLVVLSADVDTSSPAGEALLTVAAAFSQFESRMISERVKRQHQARRERGVVWGLDEGLQSRLAESVVAQIVTLREQGFSLRGIASELNTQGVATSAGASWQAVKVSRVLNSPRVKSLTLSEVEA